MTLGHLLMELRAMVERHSSACPVLVDVGDGDLRAIDRVHVDLASLDVSGAHVLDVSGYPVAVVKVRA